MSSTGYTIDGDDFFATYGVTVVRSKGFLDFLKRKTPLFQSWEDEDGEQPFTDANDIFFETVKPVLSCLMEGNDLSDFITNHSALKTKLEATGLRTIKTPWTGAEEFEVYFVDGATPEMLSKTNSEPVLARFNLKFRIAVPARG